MRAFSMFTAVAVQPRIRLPYPGADTFDEGAVAANVAAGIRAIRTARATLDAGLVAFPEFFLTGYTYGVGVDGWLRASIRIPGPETDGLSEAAVREGVHVAGAAYEVIDGFPGRFFNTAFLIAPNGDVILRYRKLYAMTTKTRPVDVLDEWLERFGPDSLFPVADTPLGRIGAMIARDSHWPEVARCLALRGAEILFNPNASGGRPPDAGMYARRGRAYENHCYLISPNIGPFANGDEEAGVGREPSEIIDYRGRILSSREAYDDFMVSARIDVEALRGFRVDGGEKGNFLAQLQPQLHAPVYRAAELFPSNGWRHTPIRADSENEKLETEVIGRMLANELMVPPRGHGRKRA